MSEEKSKDTRLGMSFWSCFLSSRLLTILCGLDSDELATASSASLQTSSSTAGLTVEALRQYLAEKLGFVDSDKSDTPKVKVLDDVSLDGVVDYFKTKGCKNVITMAGAGISTCKPSPTLRIYDLPLSVFISTLFIFSLAAGIPDFRSPGTGLYHNLTKYNLPHPQAIFELDFFHTNPKPFFVLAKELYPGTFEPTICHHFIRLLHEKGCLLRHYTQNIDTLERVAGVPADKLVEAHGTFHTGHCVECNSEYTLEWMKGWWNYGKNIVKKLI